MNRAVRMLFVRHSASCLCGVICLVCAGFFLACQQPGLRTAYDYSGLLPDQQLLYLSLSTQPQAAKAGFPYRQVQAKFLQEKRLQNFVAKRLLRSQAALGPQGQFCAVNQLVLDSKVFRRQMAKQDIWQPIAQVPGAYLHSSGQQALQMPERNLLYLSQGPQQSVVLRGKEQQDFYHLLQSGNQRSQLPQKFRDLQNEVPLVVYSSHVIDLIVHPLLQKAFPATLSSFSKVSRQFPVSGLLVWIAVTANKKAPFALHLELTSKSSLLSKGLEAGFRLFLPSLILRSKQEFIRKQLPNIRLESVGQDLLFELPLDVDSLAHILEQLKFAPGK